MDLSYGLLSLQPKDKDGHPIENLEDYAIMEGNRELKAWDAIARYMQSFDDTDGDGIRENSAGEKLQFTIRCSNDSKTRENAVLFVKECLKKVGIEVEVSIEEDGVIAEDCIYNHNFEMYALNCYFGKDPNPYFWWHSSSASDEEGVASFNFGSYKNASVDENIEKGLSTMDQNERKAAYTEVAKQINEDAPMIFLYVQNREIMCNSDLDGFDPGSFNVLYNVQKWSLAK